MEFAQSETNEETQVMRESHIGVELAYEAGEVAVLQVSRKQVALEGVRVPDDEAATAVAPGDHLLGRRVRDHVIEKDISRCQHKPNIHVLNPAGLFFLPLSTPKIPPQIKAKSIKRI